MWFQGITYVDVVLWVDHAISIVGGAIIAYGVARSIFDILYHAVRREDFSYNSVRRFLTSKILIALEFFIAADLIRTIVEPTSVNEIMLLGGIVAIRTVIEYFLNKELKDLPPEERKRV